MKSYNNVSMRGRLYKFAIDEVSTDKGEALSGKLTVEVSEDGTLVECDYFAYPVYNSGKPNKNYLFLDEMRNGEWKTVVDHGDAADWIDCSANIDSQYYISKKAGNGEVLKSQKIRGSFINLNNSKAYLNQWKLDMLITGVTEVPEDVERKLPRYVKVAGYQIDDYRGRVLGVDFNAFSEGAVNYLLGLPVSEENPYYVSCWGQYEKRTSIITIENAFGEPETMETSSMKWSITGMNPAPYLFGEEVTVEEYTGMKASLAAHLEEVIAKAEDKDAEDLAF